MKFSNGFITGRNQLQWVVLLLAAAVVLPTVALLWFMSRVVANERLVVREKLAVIYQDKLLDAAAETEALCTERIKSLDEIQQTSNPYSILTQLVLENGFQGVIIQDADGVIVYPTSVNVTLGLVRPDGPLAIARQLEFTDRKYDEAAMAYDRFSIDSDPNVAITAIIGNARCLSRLGRFDEAIDSCRNAAFAEIPDDASLELRIAVENARLLLLTLVNKSPQPQRHNEIFRQTVSELAADLYNTASQRTPLPANQNLFIAKKLLQALDDVNLPAESFLTEKDKLEKLAAAEEISISAAQNNRILPGYFDSFFRIDLGRNPAYGVRHRAQSATLVGLFDENGIESVLAGYEEAFAGPETMFRIVNASGRLVAGTAQLQDKPFATAPLPQYFPGWTAELYFAGSEVFDEAAKRQITIYVWTAVLVILLILIAGGFATRAVGRQIRLNKMKNDFIATVSHELKTPLASMRVLVDTLLEGNVKDEAQAEEYLRLTSKENERLSRMIDNFLTFSRMERNKKAFTITEAEPAAIARDAAEAVKAKFEANNCRFTLESADNLPEAAADHDAIVTVLVNLLDNACKYTGEEKQISLKVFAEDDNVCFAVTDNGVGLSRRQIRRIFDSFYQADSSLARRAEGCGLGLSIVKFIVDAHKGTISVDSKPGRGSTFTVRIPVWKNHSD